MDHKRLGPQIEGGLDEGKIGARQSKMLEPESNLGNLRPLSEILARLYCKDSLLVKLAMSSRR